MSYVHKVDINKLVELDEIRNNKNKLESFMIKNPEVFEVYFSLINLSNSKKEIENYLELGYKNVLKSILKNNKWPDRIKWGFLENRALLSLLFEKAVLYWKDNNLEEALNLFRQILKMNPDDNQGVRNYILGIKLGYSLESFENELFTKEGYYDNDALEKLEKNMDLFPEEFEEWKKNVNFEDDLDELDEEDYDDEDEFDFQKDFDIPENELFFKIISQILFVEKLEKTKEVILIYKYDYLLLLKLIGENKSKENLNLDIDSNQNLQLAILELEELLALIYSIKKDFTDFDLEILINNILNKNTGALNERVIKKKIKEEDFDKEMGVFLNSVLDEIFIFLKDNERIDFIKNFDFQVLILNLIEYISFKYLLVFEELEILLKKILFAIDNRKIFPKEVRNPYLNYIGAFFNYSNDEEVRLLVKQYLELERLKKLNRSQLERILSFSSYEDLIEIANEYKSETDYMNLNRNDLCFCGSGKKFKKCCIDKFNKNLF